MSEEELVELLRKEADEEEEEEGRELKEGGDEVKVETGEAARGDEYEEAEGEQKKREEADTDESGVMGESVVEEVEKVPQNDQMEMLGVKKADQEDNAAQLEEIGSTESEIPGDLDYAADSGVLQPAKVKSLIDATQDLLKTDVKEKETREKDVLTVSDDYDQDVQNTEAADSEEVAAEDKSHQDKETEAKRKGMSEDVDAPERKGNTEHDSGKEEEKSKMDNKGKTKKQKKNQRAKNRSPQREEAQSGQDQNQQEPQESDNTVHKAKRRRAGKWVNVLPFSRMVSLMRL